MKKYLFILPVIPNYRLKLFRRVSEIFQNLEILAGTHQCIGPSSAKESNKIASLNHNVICLFSQKIMWQKNISLSSKYKKGDVVLISGNPRILTNYLIIVLAKYRGLKIVWYGQGWTAGSNNLRNFIKRIVMSFCDVVILYTEKEAQNINLFFFGDKKIHFLNNTVDTEDIFSIKKKITKNMLNNFLEQNSLEEKKIILFVGRLEGKESLNVLLDSFNKVLSKIENAFLVVIGSGSMTSEYKERSINNGISHNILWLGPEYKEKDLAYWFLVSHCFVYPGAIGLSLLHAFSYSLPVITHNNLKNHMPEISAFKDTHNGLMFKEGNDDDLANKIEKMLSDNDMRKNLSINALETVKDSFTFEQMLRRFEVALNDA